MAMESHPPPLKTPSLPREDTALRLVMEHAGVVRVNYFFYARKKIE
jgi:hypothetical protein